MKRILLFAVAVLIAVQGNAQSLKKPDVPDPSLLRIKKAKKTYIGRSAGYMGLFDWNFSLGYIDKTAHQAAAPIYPADLSTSGQYAMFHLQEGILSNYFFAKSYKKDKRFKFGIQNTFDLGVKRGSATGDSSNYATTKRPVEGDLGVFFNYQFGLAGVVRVTPTLDIGYTYYPYVKSVFRPGDRTYAKLRVRYSRFMAEYSINGMKSLELKYLRGRKMYIGLAYTEGRQGRNEIYGSGYGATNINTNWIHLSLGRVF